MEKITSREAGFTHKELVKEALQHAMGDVTKESIDQKITEKRKSGELMALLNSSYFNRTVLFLLTQL